MAAKIWIDVEDIFMFAVGGGRRPNGIQRLSFELCRAMARRSGDSERIRFVRHDRFRDGLAVVPWSEVEALFTRLITAADETQIAASAAPAGGVGLRRRVAAMLRPLGRWLAPETRAQAVRVLRLQFQAVVALYWLVRMLAHGLVMRLRAPWRGRAAVAQAAPVAAGPARPAAGDILFAPGAVFVHPEYGAFIEKLARRDGLRVALLIYDIIPLRRPEWCGQAHVHSFRAWFDDVVPRCEILLAISRSAASEAEAYARLNGLALRDQVHAIPIGTGFTTGENHAAPAQTDGLPAPGSYVLCVATIEARKNHLLLFRVWRRLIEAMGADAVPKLALAGRVGWMVGDLMEQMRNTNFLDGHIILVDHPDDGQLEALYRGCLFTVFPSLYEGWGLPVTESLAFGKPCVISNSTSLPEAGGALARYFDPENIAEATEVIRATLADRAGLDAWQAQVAREFRPVPWDESARAVFDRLA